jgi:hypothetical protein
VEVQENRLSGKERINKPVGNSTSKRDEKMPLKPL